MDRHNINLRQIAVSGENLIAFQPGRINPDTLDRALALRFDYAPLVADNGEPLGIVKIGLVKDRYLTRQELTLADQMPDTRTLPESLPVLDFLQLIATQEAAVVYGSNTGEDQRRFGFLTISDLNRHLFRAEIYPILAELEEHLGDFISLYYRDPAGLIAAIGERNRDEIRRRWYAAVDSRIETSPLSYCNLPEMINIVAKTSYLYQSLDFASRTEFEKAVGKLAQLRNDIMHPIRPLISSVDDIPEVQASVKQALDLLNRATHSNPRTMTAS